MAVAAIACLALGLSSFATPVAERPEAPVSLIAAHQIVVVLPEARGCAADPQHDGDRDAAIAQSAKYLRAKRSRLTDTEIKGVAEVLVDCARYYDIEPALVLAVIHVESRGNTFALSPVGAMGLMQIMPATGEELATELGFRWVGSKLLFDPEINVQLGIAYLRELRERFGNWSTALAAYNWGPGQISRRLRNAVGERRAG